MYDEYRGLYNQGEQYLYVNTGLGQTAVNARFGATPEITLITLKTK
jgi:predicted MPP superfamily phosphohydrolase